MSSVIGPLRVKASNQIFNLLEYIISKVYQLKIKRVLLLRYQVCLFVKLKTFLVIAEYESHFKWYQAYKKYYLKDLAKYVKIIISLVRVIQGTQKFKFVNLI